MNHRFLAATLGVLLVLVLGFGGRIPAEDPPKDEPAGSARPQIETKAPEATPGVPSKSDAAATQDTEKPKAKPGLKTEKATFGTGCFWCGEAVFERLRGVKTVVSGYAGGSVPNPTYEMVSSGMTGHAEVFQVEFDPAVVPYEKLLQVFWASHDPTTPNQQGPDFGTQYRSVIFYHNEAQKLAAQKSYQELVSHKKTLLGAISTQLVPYTTFYPAEPYHQDYYRNHPYADYCQMWIVPKLRKLKLPLSK